MNIIASLRDLAIPTRLAARSKLRQVLECGSPQRLSSGRQCAHGPQSASELAYSKTLPRRVGLISSACQQPQRWLSHILHALWLGSAACVPAAPVAIEPFECANGPLTGQSGGNGWVGGWGSSTFQATNSQAFLEYSGLNSNVEVARSLEAPLAADTIYFSARIRSTDTDGCRIEVKADVPGNNRALHFGISGSSYEVIMRATSSNDTERNAVSGSYPVGEAVFLVARLELNVSGTTNDTISLWTGTDALESDPPVVTLTHDIAQSSITALRLFCRSLDTGNAWFDDLRVGHTWADVNGTVSSQPVIQSFVAWPPAITEGDSALLSWTVFNADRVTVAPEIGDVTGLTTNGNGSLEVAPANTTTYTLSISNSNAVAAAETTVTVLPPGLVRPNFLFIAIDDLKPICGHMSEEPGNFLQDIYPDPVLRAQKRLVLTPNIDRLAGQGVSFLRAYCPTPACNPSRAGILTGIRPHVSTFVANNGGIFFRDWASMLASAVTLPQQLRLNGYFTAGTGKIFHNASHAGADAPLSWNQWVVLSGSGSWTKSPWSPKSAPTLWTGDADWGVYNVSLTNLQDYKRADFVARLIENGTASDYDSGLGRNVTLTLPTNAPFFLACGIFHPHVPYSNPPELLALFPTNEITFTRQMLVDGTNDLYDLPPTGLTFVPANTNGGDAVLTGGDFRAIAQQGQALEPGDGDLHAMRDMISHYLASAALADRCVGRLLDALDSSPYATNTIVALWSDHGYHLGEKLRACTKFTLWENAANVVFVMRDLRRPGGQRCYRTVGTGDLYQTLCSMAGVAVPATVSGRDLSPLLANPQRPWNIPALTTITRTNHNAIRTEPFRYIRYHGDVNDAELYHMDVDPDEITNVLTRAEYAPVRAAVNHLLEIALTEGTFPEEQVLSLPNWRNGYWGHGLNVGAAADLVDADNDGITNVLEAVLGLNPLRPDTNTMPRLAMPSAAAGADLFYRTTYLPITNGPMTEVQATADLLNWSTLWNSNVPGAVDSVTSSQLPDGRLVLEIPVATTNHPNQSYRLKVHHP